MSAFIVEDQTINRVIGYVTSKLQGDHRYRYLFDKLLKAAGTSPADERWPSQLGVSMAALNDQAMDARYRQGTAAKDRAGVAYKFHWETATPIQALKSLQCWHYQCSEGDICETSELYKVAEELIGYIACRIVSGLPEYDRAQWG